MPHYDKIIFTPHGAERAQERGISYQMVKSVLENHEIEYPMRDGKRRFSKKIDGTKLTVVIRESKNGQVAHVVSPYWPT